jgi:hypothetical protein
MTVQTAFSTNNKAGVPGMLYDKDFSSLIDSKPCGATTLIPGQMVELVSGVLQPCQGTGDPDSNPVWGVVMFGDAMEPNPTTGAGEYVYGLEVPVLRKGRIWVQLAAAVSSIVPGAAVNFSHSSTTATERGFFTTAAVSGTAGSEVSAVKGTWFADGGLIGGTPSCAAIDISYP